MKISKIVLLMVFLLLILGCNNNENQDNPQNLSTYKHSMSGVPRSLDPIKASDKYANAAILTIFDTLYSYKYLARPYELKPNLAEALPTVLDEGKTYIIKIKPGNYFHNHHTFPNGIGREVIAEDFIYSIKRNFDPLFASTGKWLWRDYVLGLQEWVASGSDYDQRIDGLIALDKFTIQIKLTKPYPQLIHSLSMGYAAIVPREPAEFYGKKFSTSLIGSGPFIFESFDSNILKLEKNHLFRQEPVNLEYEGYDSLLHGRFGLGIIDGKSPPFINKLEIHYITESMSRWLSFNKSNEIQYTTIPPQLSNKVLKSKKPITIKSEMSLKYNYSYDSELGFAYFGFNMNASGFGYSADPIQNKKNRMLRCAIRKAHNWSQRNEAFYFGIGNVFPGVIVPKTYDYDPGFSSDSITYDLQGAKQLLVNANWNETNLPVFEYHAVGNVENQKIYEQTRGFLMQMGYPNSKVKFQPYINFGELNKGVINGRAPFFFMGWNMDYPDAQNTMQMFYGPNKSPGPNAFSYNNKNYDQLYEQALTMPETPERKKIYTKLNHMVVDDCVAISGINRTFISLWHKEVVFHPTEDITGSGFLKYVALKPFTNKE